MRVPRPQPSQLGAGALIVAALAVGQVLSDQLPDGKDGDRLFEQKVAMGESVALRMGDLKPIKVEGATAVLRDMGSSFRSPGLGVVVSFDFVARREATALTYGEYRGGDGTVTTFSTGPRNKVSCPSSPPGVTVHCTAVIEVDPASLPGASLGIAADALDPRYDDMAVIDLGIRNGDVRRWKQVEELTVVVSSVDGVS